LNGGPGWT